MALKLTNNATSTLNGSITDVATTVAVQTADAALFPTLGAGDWFPVTVVDAAGNMEVMRCTARAGASLTVTRAQENTTAKAFASGSRIDLRATASALDALRDRANHTGTQLAATISDLLAGITALITGVAAKTTPVDADKIGFFDSAAAFAYKLLTFADLKATLLTYFLTIFARRVETRRNLLVNGSMQISQENGNTLGTTNGYYPADQWALYFTAATAAMSVQRVQARTLAGALDQIEVKTTTAKAVLAAGDVATLTQNIEGSNPDFVAAQFGTANAKPLVLRKEVKLPAGTYHWHLSNSAANRHCAVPFTISAGEANTAVVKEIVVPPDTSGTWLTADGVIGITFDLVLAAGSTKTGGSASTWGATAYYAASTQFNILSSTSNVARLADVGLKLDPDATGVYGAYEVGEVDPVYRAERYVWKVTNDSSALATIAPGVYGDTVTFVAIIYFPVLMCKPPGFGVSGVADFNVYPRSLDTTNMVADNITRFNARLLATVSGGTSYEAGLLRFDGSASRYLFFPARLS